MTTVRWTWLIAGALASTLAARSAHAQVVSWQAPATYAAGFAPAVAMSGFGLGWMVEEHAASNCGVFCSAPFWSGAGTWASGTFGGVSLVDQGGSGLNRLAGDAGSGSLQLVEVHEPYTWSDFSQPVWYRVGTLDPVTGRVGWGGARSGPAGTQLGLAIGNSGIGGATAVLVNSIARVDGPLPRPPDGNLYYELGTVNADGASITWGPPIATEGGQSPAVAMLYTGSRFFIAQVHEDFSGNLWLRTGTLTPGASTIAWTAVAPYDRGTQPTIALCSNFGGTPIVVEVHQGGPGTLWYRSGLVDTVHATIQLGGSAQISTASGAARPRVACAGRSGALVYGAGTSIAPVAVVQRFTAQ